MFLTNRFEFLLIFNHIRFYIFLIFNKIQDFLPFTKLVLNFTHNILTFSKHIIFVLVTKYLFNFREMSNSINLTGF